MGKLTTYASLFAYANNAITVIEPIKQAFIDRGAAATVIEDIQASVAALIAAGGRGYTGRGKQIGKNVDLRHAIRAGREQVRILDGILSILLKPTPGLLVEWKAAKRIQVGPRSAAAQPAAGTGELTQPVGS